MTREEALKSFEEENKDFEKIFERYGYQMSPEEVSAVKESIERNKMAISALSESENTGEWISTEDRPDGFCSKCDTDIYEVSTPYCPYCGAKMTWVGAIHEPYKKGE